MCRRTSPVGTTTLASSTRWDGISLSTIGTHQNSDEGDSRVGHGPDGTLQSEGSRGNANMEGFPITPGAEFEVESTAGDLLTFDEVQKLDQAIRQTTLSDFVHLSTWTTPVSITLWRPDEDVLGLEIVADAEDNCTARFPLIPDTVERVPKEGLMLRLIELEGGRHTALIVARIHGSWERIGYYAANYKMSLHNASGEKVREDYGSRLEKEWRTIRLS